MKAGRKPLKFGEPMAPRTIRLTERQWRTFEALGGGPWLRGLLDQAPEQFQTPRCDQ